jgi:hypothetical protein
MMRFSFRSILVSSVLVMVVLAITGTRGDHLRFGRSAQAAGQTTIFLPNISYHPLTPPYDMARILAGDSRLYEVQHSSGSQARHQTQTDDYHFFHTKGDEINAEWEELWYTDEAVYRGTDTSPGNNLYYTLRDVGIYGSAWAPRFWNVGELYERNPAVTFYDKSDCSVVMAGHQRSWLKFETFHQQFTFDSGITLDNVIELSWLLAPDGQPIERYLYAYRYGLVGWWSDDGQQSYVSELHEPGTRPDSQREIIPCLDRTAQRLPLAPEQTLPYWPGEHRR